MPSLVYGTGAFKRDRGNLPPLRLVNMFVEKARTSENQVTLQSRNGLSTIVTNGSGPINGIYAARGVFSGDYFTVSGSTLYRNTISEGAVAGSGPASFAGCTSELLIARGGTLYSYNGTDLADSGFAGDQSNNATAVCFIGSLFVAIEADSARFYWSTPLDGRAWDVLNFATAEREPDNLLDIRALGDNIWLFGQGTIEAWAHTGAADLPFSRIEQVAFDKGIIATGAVTAADNSLYFTGSDGVVYRIGEVPQRVSDHWLEEKIAASASVAMFSFKLEGHEFVCVRLDSETFALDVATSEWCELQTDGGQFGASCAAMVGTDVYLGSDADGKVYGFDGWDDDGVALERRFTAALQLDEPASIDNLRLWANVGQSDVLSGTGSDPVVEMRSSRDAGQTWSDFDDAALGNAALGGTGEYRTIPEWRRLGMFDFPGLLVEFRVTDPVPLRISAAKANERGGGRSRG